MNKALVMHRIATAAAGELLKAGVDAGLSWTDMVISCETMLSICVAAAAKMVNPPDPQRWATKIIDEITMVRTLALPL